MKLITEEVPKTIFDDVMEYAAGKLSDDIAVLAISLEGE